MRTITVFTEKGSFAYTGLTDQTVAGGIMLGGNDTTGVIVSQAKVYNSSGSITNEQVAYFPTARVLRAEVVDS